MPDVIKPSIETGLWLLTFPLQLLVQKWFYGELHRHVKQDPAKMKRLVIFDPPTQTPDLMDNIRLIVTLGGDGSLLYLNGLFQQGAVPPVMAFAYGTLSFISPFALSGLHNHVRRFFSTGASAPILSRIRLLCEVVRKDPGGPDKAEVSESFHALNEAVVSRSGPTPGMLDLSCNGRQVAVCQGDGVIVATPTGSTAYSLSAGGSIVHPGLGAMLLTPVCPHALSFRPLVLQPTALLRLKVPIRARAPTAHVSFDGHVHLVLNRGDALRLTASPFPFLSLIKWNISGEWFHSLSTCLSWNRRVTQTALPEEIVKARLEAIKKSKGTDAKTS